MERRCGEIGRAARRAEAGLSLAELLVASALALVALTVSLALLEVLRRDFLRNTLSTDALQRARLAVDTIARDLSAAGEGVDPDGALNRPDEGIEGSWAGAIALRGDLDGRDPASRDDPEQWIAGPFPSVRTGNDEVVAYLLRPESGTGGDDIAFEADVHSPLLVSTPAGIDAAARDGAPEEVRLTRVVAAAGGPAGVDAILYRASVSNNAASWGTGNALVWRPVADGIAELSFRYFDAAGHELVPAGGEETERSARAQIACVEIRAAARERAALAAWSTSPGVPGAPAAERRAELARRVCPAGLGLGGQPDRHIDPELFQP